MYIYIIIRVGPYMNIWLGTRQSGKLNTGPGYLSEYLVTVGNQISMINEY